MSVQVSLSKKTIELDEYPKLMIDKEGMVVLFREKESGFVVYPKPGYYLCYTSDRWDMEYFIKHDGEINLKNE